MGNFFSTGPIDYGADQIARGYAGLSNSINRVGDYFADSNRMKQQAAIEEQKRKTALEEQIKMEAARQGVQPVIDPQTQQLNVFATVAATKKAADLQERLQRMAALKDHADFNTQQEAIARGISPAAQDGVPLERSIYLKDQEDKNAQYERQRQIAANEELARQRAARKAQQQDAFATALGRAPTPEELDQDGNLTPASLKALSDAKQAANLTPTQRNARASVDTGVKAGYIKPEDADQAAAMFEASGGRAPKLPQALSDAVDGDARRLTGLRPLEDQVSKYDKSGFGPVSFRVATAVGGLTGAGGEDARAIEQQYKKVSSGEAFAQGGKQLTKTELDAIIAQVGKPTDADFPARIQQYHDTVIRDAKVHLDQLEQSPYRFTAEGQAAIARLQSLINGPAAPATEQVTAPAAMTPEQRRARIEELRKKLGQ